MSIILNLSVNGKRNTVTIFRVVSWNWYLLGSYHIKSDVLVHVITEDIINQDNGTSVLLIDIV